ncbi:succinate dehydrogenase assembly factor 2 [Sphingorhabdus arenilitoris]|uniref:FAD assembly factor SdhE n=1 Tax=Sphingorhabdus arenilitoris TaxID=1490041 RepID=A0ABV8RIG7_9SPHN
MDADATIRKLRFRASHRGTREADAMVGGFFESYHQNWTAEEFAWFEELLEQQDVDIMAWAMGTAAPPPEFQGPMMDTLKRLDFITLPPGLSKQY